jgi:hypothetical protein
MGRERKKKSKKQERRQERKSKRKRKTGTEIERVKNTFLHL